VLPADGVAATTAPAPPSPPPAAAVAPGAATIGPELEQAIDHAVARHIGPLREQLDAFEDAIRFRDILGGLGWIVGVTGIACYLIGRRHG
jgi:nickel transport protein